MPMKTLNSVLYNLSRKKDISVKIGSKNGSGLWYCAKLTTHTHNDIDIENKIIRTRETRYLKKLQHKIADLDGWYEKEIARWLANPKNQKKSETVKQAKITHMLKSKELDRTRIPITIKEIEYDIDNSFLNRPVLEMVDGISPDEPNTKIIYVSGYEHGDYWTIKEYTKDHLPQEQQATFNTRLSRLSENENYGD